MKREWYCYVCGNKVDNEFLLWSMRDRTDRIFICCLKNLCRKRIEGETLIIKVKEI